MVNNNQKETRRLKGRWRGVTKESWREVVVTGYDQYKGMKLSENKTCYFLKSLSSISNVVCSVHNAYIAAFKPQGP